jgi:hypothetical protein
MERSLRCGSRRRLFGLACAVLLAGAQGAQARVDVASETPTLVSVTPTEIRARVPIDEIAVDGTHVAFKLCGQVLSVWRPGATHVVKVGPLRFHTCPSPFPQRVYSLALAGDRLAYAADPGGIQINAFAQVVDLARPRIIQSPVNLNRCCRGTAPGFPEQRLGWILGDRSLLVFSSFIACGDQGAPACSDPRRPTLLSQAAWRLRRTGTAGVCPGRPGPCRLLVAVNARLVPASVQRSRVALMRATGVIEVRNGRGQLIRTFPGVAGIARAAELDGGRLIVLTRANILQFAVRTGRLLRTRPMMALPGASGFCGILPCLSQPLTLEDAARGLVVYRTGGRLHLLRLRDGRRASLGTGTAARFGSTGLFYAYRASGGRPGRVRFVPFSQLALRP